MVRQSQVDPGPDTLLADLLRLPDSTDPVRWLQDHRLSLAARLVLEHLLQRVVPMEDLVVSAINGSPLRSIRPRVHTRSNGRLHVSPNPPMDRDGRREDSGRGEGVTGAMIRARIWVDGRLAGGLQALLGAPMAAYSGCGERDGGIGHGKRRSRTGLARVCGDVGLVGGSVADGRRQAGSGMARSRARARLNRSSQGQRRGRCRVNRRAERVIRPAKAKTRRLRVLVVTIC